ncbi:0bf8483d-dc74-44f7-934a-38e30b9bc143 [Sclerotinia trifoliorum]|uniref:0bf8483d-dc74-44f7-934a-38e30b9bc143 n=1 Tax=Sclerotinia trifoliorum TaxID=28548 RepID=A0A8H2VVC3_9HELO|nr:0bf8483d-dc74-44f7-934a-38e30b9bc143 [Sclerotinia trifoliorum]
MQREIVAELKGNGQFPRHYREILGVRALWFWVPVALLAAGIGGGIAGGMKSRNKNNDLKQNQSQSTLTVTNVNSPCQTDPCSNNTIVQVIPGMDMKPTNFRLFCNRTFDVDSSIMLQHFAVPNTVADLGGCMEACLDYNAGNGTESGTQASYGICYAVTISKNETSGQEWCSLFAASGWGTDEVGADCAVNLSPPSLVSSSILTAEISGTRSATTSTLSSTRPLLGAEEICTTNGLATKVMVATSLLQVVPVSSVMIGGQTFTASPSLSTPN